MAIDSADLKVDGVQTALEDQLIWLSKVIEGRRERFRDLDGATGDDDQAIVDMAGAMVALAKTGEYRAWSNQELALENYKRDRAASE